MNERIIVMSKEKAFNSVDHDVYLLKQKKSKIFAKKDTAKSCHDQVCRVHSRLTGQ